MEFTQINHSTKIFDGLHARFDFFVDKTILVPQDEFFIVAKLLVQLNIMYFLFEKFGFWKYTTNFKLYILTQYFQTIQTNQKPATYRNIDLSTINSALIRFCHSDQQIGILLAKQKL
jgi:hypothetical protein